MICDKLRPKLDKCYFVGYPRETKGYYLFNHVENKIVIARHGTFLEKEFLARRSSENNVNIENVQETLNIGDSTLDVMSSESETISNIQNVVQES
jgi:hypothetical protein